MAIRAPAGRGRRWLASRLRGLAVAAGLCRMCAAADVWIIVSSGAPAYQEAVRGLEETLGSRCTVLEAGPNLADRLAGGNAKLVVAVGSAAAEQALACRLEAPVIAAMVTGSRWRRPGARLESPLAAISLEIPWPAALERLRRIFPNKRRLGLIHNPGHEGPPPGELRETARRLGFTLEVAECPEVRQLLRALVSLERRADLVVCVTDSTLYNRATVEPLVLTSLKHRLPIVGFSESFVRAGAAAGLYPDFHDVGRQAGELALRFLEGEAAPGLHPPRKVRAAVNQRVLRLLGLEHAAEGEAAILK